MSYPHIPISNENQDNAVQTADAITRQVAGRDPSRQSGKSLYAKKDIRVGMDPNLCTRDDRELAGFPARHSGAAPGKGGTACSPVAMS